MSERYTKVFALPENLYAEGSPVVVSAGHLLRDNQTGKVLAQLKIKNISSKAIRAATVLIHGQDTAGKAIDGDAQQKYLDLTAKTGEEFGQKTAVPLPDTSTRAFSLEVTQVVFEDSSTWEGTQAPWEPLPEAVSLSKELGDAELVKQYKLKAGAKCAVYPKAHKDLWLCACGTWNRGGKCYACGQEKDVLLNLDLAALTAEKDARLAKEKAEREAREVADRAAAEARAKKTKKVLAIAIPVIVLCVAALMIVTKVIVPNSNYNKAKALMDAGQYEEAIAAFEALDGYKDSKGQINECRYGQASELLNSGQYDGAITAFEALGTYNDAPQLLEEAKGMQKYHQAIALISDEKTENDTDALLLFQEIGNFEDAETYIKRFSPRIISSESNYYDKDHRHYQDGTVLFSYDTNGQLCATSRTIGRESYKSTEIDTVGMYTIVYYNEGGIKVFYTDHPGMTVFSISRKGDRGTYDGFSTFIDPTLYLSQSVIFSIEQEDIVVNLKGDWDGEYIFRYRKNGDISFYERHGTEEESKEYSFSQTEKTLHLSALQDTVSCEFDQFGLLAKKRTTKRDNSFQIEYDEAGYPLRWTEYYLNGAYNTTDFEIGYIYIGDIGEKSQ